jgi:protein O-mannosyl-transferase
MNQNKTREGIFNKSTILIVSCIVLTTGLLYYNSLKGEFLSYDDTDNVVNNPVIRQLSLSTLRQIFSTGILYMYTPVTFLSYAIDYKVFGLNPYFFKLTSLLIHLLNIILVYVVSVKLLGKRNPALLMTLLFAVHPMNVDSVSWISGRSNLLSALFFLLSLIFYLNYMQKERTVHLLLSILLFVFSLLSKSTGVMFPFTLLLIDYLQRRKFTVRLVLGKLPYFVISAIIGLITIYFRSDSGNTQSVGVFSFSDHFFMICYADILYMVRMLFPVHLSEVYAYPIKSNGFLPFIYYLAPVFLVGLSVAVYRLKIVTREIAFGICFFLVNIILTQLLFLEDGFTANRYTYVPYIGIFFIIAQAYDNYTLRRPHMKIFSMAMFAVLLVISGYLSYDRSLVWKNTMSLFNHVIERSPESAFAHNNRGIARYYGNDTEGALEDYSKAIDLNPKYAGAFYNRGIVYNALRDYDKAMADYTKAIDLNPGFATSLAARGILEMDVYKMDSLALRDYNRAIELNPAFGLAYYNRAILELRMNDVADACKDFLKVRSLGYSQADDLISQYCN